MSKGGVYSVSGAIGQHDTSGGVTTSNEMNFPNLTSSAGILLFR
jgi:hypothetical protein